MYKYLVFFMMLAISGCASMQPADRYIDNGAFYSSKDPSIKINTSSEYVYVGSFDASFKSHHSNDPTITAEVKRIIHNYVYANDNNEIRKLIQINVQDLPSSKNFVANLFDTSKSLKHGVLRLSDINFQYEIRVAKNVGDMTSEFLLDNGFFSTNCLIYISAGRRFGSNNNVRFYLNYFEDISDHARFRVKSCDNWTHPNLLNKEQIALINNLEDIFKKNIYASEYLEGR